MFYRLRLMILRAVTRILGFDTNAMVVRVEDGRMTLNVSQWKELSPEEAIKLGRSLVSWGEVVAEHSPERIFRANMGALASGHSHHCNCGEIVKASELCSRCVCSPFAPCKNRVRARILLFKKECPS